MAGQDQDPMIPERVEQFALTVGAVWREARVSCPHRDVLRAYHDGSLDEGASDYLRFHIEDAMCPYCQANLEDFARQDADAASQQLEGLRSRLLSSTMSILRKKRERDK